MYNKKIYDILILFKGINIDGQNVRIINNLNITNKNIWITFGIQLDNKINFLDLTVHVSNNKFNFYFYRISIQINTMIPKRF